MLYSVCVCVYLKYKSHHFNAIQRQLLIPSFVIFFVVLVVFVFCLGGTGRFGSASGSVKTKEYVDFKNEDTGYYEDYIEVQFNVCVPPPKNTNPAPPGPPKKSGKTNKASF